jgi:hypothetical protein
VIEFHFKLITLIQCYGASGSSLIEQMIVIDLSQAAQFQGIFDLHIRAVEL